MIVREFLTRLNFDADDRKVKSFDDRVRQLRTALLAVVGAATAASAAAFKLANDTARYGDELAKTSDRLGINVDALEQLRFAAERSGVAQNTLEMALQRMTRRLSEAAAGGGEAQKAIQELGLNAQALGEMAPEDALNTLSDALSGVENNSERVRLAFKFFDSEGVALLNMLGDGSEEVNKLRQEFERLSGGLTEDQARASEKFTDALTNMQAVMQGLRLQIGAKLMPIFQPMVEAFTEFLIVNREMILERIHQTFEVLIGVLRTLGQIISTVFGVVNDVVQLFGGWENAIELIGIALGVLMGLGLLRFLRSAKAAILALNFAMLLNPAFLMVAGMTALVLAIQDVSFWIRDQESVLGELVGSYEDFKKRASEFFKPITDAWNDYTQAVKDWLDGDWVGGSQGILSAIGGVLIQLRDLFNQIFVDPILNLWGTSVEQMAQALKGAMADAFKWVANKAKNMLPAWAINIIEGRTGGDLEPGQERSGGGSGTGGSGTNDTFMRREQLTPGQILFDGGDGADGRDGRSGPDGGDGADGRDGRSGPDGGDGADGNDGVERVLFDFSDFALPSPVMPSMPAQASSTTNSLAASFVTNIEVTVPPGSNQDQAEFIATRVRREVEREVNRAATALEA